jgi:hypothetical protein
MGHDRQTICGWLGHIICKKVTVGIGRQYVVVDWVTILVSGTYYHYHYHYIVLILLLVTSLFWHPRPRKMVDGV